MRCAKVCHASLSISDLHGSTCKSYGVSAAVLFIVYLAHGSLYRCLQTVGIKVSGNDVLFCIFKHLPMVKAAQYYWFSPIMLVDEFKSCLVKFILPSCSK